MKSILVILFCSSFACSANPIIHETFALENYVQLIHEFEPLFARAIAEGFVKRLAATGTKEGPAPELDDTVTIPDFSLDLADLNIPIFTGDASFNDGTITGLSTLVDDLVLILFPALRIKYDLTGIDLELKGNYTLDMLINQTVFVDTVTGSGAFNAKLTKPFLALGLNINANFTGSGHMNVSNVILDLGFDALTINAEGLKINDFEVPWDEVNLGIKLLFDLVWKLIQDPVTVGVTDVLNDLLKGCTLVDFLQGKFECIIMPTTPTTTQKSTTFSTGSATISFEFPTVVYFLILIFTMINSCKLC